MAKIFHVCEDSIGIAGPFATWAEAKAWMTEHSSGDEIQGCEDPTEPESDPFPSNPEPQEMTVEWVRNMERNA